MAENEKPDSQQEEEGAKRKLGRGLLYWTLPGIFIPTVLILLFSKGSDLGQKEAELAEEAKRQEERSMRMSARVEDPEAAAQEDARRAKEKLEEQRKELLPPPPELDVSKSDEIRMRNLMDAREIVGSTLSDPERQSTGLADTPKDEGEKRKSFVVYTAPAKEGMIASAVKEAAAEVSPVEKKEEKKESPKAHFTANEDKVEQEQTTVSKRVPGLYWIAPGTVIRAVLLNAINTQIPGQVTARVIEPVYDSRYGRYLVIPAGSTLIGQYVSDISAAQVRVMIAFSSLITPSGGVVELAGTRASDALGRLGVEGELHTHFWKRMGVALLYALESVAMDRLAQRETVVSSAGTTSKTTNTSQAAEIIAEAAKSDPWFKPIQPYITIDEGKVISVVTTGSIEIPPVANRR